MSSSPITTGETELIAAARRGEASAWENLVGDHQEAVFRMAYLIVGDPDAAEDIAQETFIRAYRALDRFDSSRPLRPWLLRISSNLSRNWRRGAWRYLNSLQRWARLEALSAVDTAQVGEAAFEAQALWSAIRRIPRRDQEVIYLRYYLNLSVQETAEVLEIAPGTVKSRVHRALKRLRQTVSEDYPNLVEAGES